MNGPASSDYDIDLGPFVLSDYYHKTADELVIYTATNGAPPSDNVLFNGTTVDPDTGSGEYAKITLTSGKKHRLRLINTSKSSIPLSSYMTNNTTPGVENHLQLSIVNHNMTIIGTDFVPVNPYPTDSLFIAVGQRYDVIIDANQDVDNYWFNVTYGGSGFCGSSNNPYPAAIVQYDGAADGNPTDEGTTPIDHQCLDPMDLVPIVTRTVPTDFTPSSDNTLDVHLDLTAPTFVWYINNSSMTVDWDKPVAQYVYENDTDYPSTNNIWQVDGADQVSHYSKVVCQRGQCQASILIAAS